MKLGIVPAGGSATRFGGIRKELLPVADGKTALEACVEKLSFCDGIVVLTTLDKIEYHASVLRNYSNVVLTISANTLWESICLTFQYPVGKSYFVMPDTWFPETKWPDKGDLEFLVFKTKNPKKYGVFVDGYIHDKEDLRGSFKAWGAVSWSEMVVDYWYDKTYHNHTEAFNDAISNFGYRTGKISEYYDFACMADYVKWLSKSVV